MVICYVIDVLSVVLFVLLDEVENFYLMVVYVLVSEECIVLVYWCFEVGNFVLMVVCCKWIEV